MESSVKDIQSIMPYKIGKLASYEEEAPITGVTIDLEDEPFFYNEHCADEVCISDPKEGPKFIKYIEGLVRTSPSYGNATKYIRYTRKLNRCCIYPNIYHRYDAMVELHHYPLTLWDIVYAVCKKYAVLEGDEYFVSVKDDLKIASEVLLLHFNEHVSFVPLSSTWHDGYHGGVLFIPLDKISPEWKNMMKDYGEYMSECAKSKISLMEEMTLNHRNSGKSDIPKAASPHTTNITIDGREMILIRTIERA